MAHNVYICHSSRDHKVADAVCTALESKGIRCWIAPRDILPGEAWEQSILEAIDRAQIVVLIFSAHANAAPRIHREVDRAVSRGLVILPMRIEDVPRDKTLDYLIPHARWFDAFTPPLEAHFGELLRWVQVELTPCWGPANWESAGAMDAAMASAPRPPAPAPPPPVLSPMPMVAPSPAPPQSAAPASSKGGGLLRAVAGLFRRSETPAAAPVRVAQAPPPLTPQPAPPAYAKPGAADRTPAPPVATSAPSTPPLASPEPLCEHVDFSVYAPHPVRPGASFLVNVWASLPGQRAAMVERATGPSGKVEVGSRGGILLPSETPLLLRLRLDGFEVDNPTEPFAWHGHVTNVAFRVTTPAQLPPASYQGEVHLLDRGMLLARFYFEVQVAAAQPGAAPPSISQAELRSQWVRSAFASYSSKDRAKVVQRVQGMSVAGVDVFLDVASLRAGHDWQQQLYRAIETRDIFYLFWSQSARASEQVEWEWRAALKRKGIEFIHPIPLEDPRLALPPTELSRLHFNDVYLAILKSTEPGDSAPPGVP